jgi:hypothetical protein
MQSIFKMHSLPFFPMLFFGRSNVVQRRRYVQRQGLRFYPCSWPGLRKWLTDEKASIKALIRH